MDKKVVLVTGSSKGLGKAIIKKFASNNYNVVINYNTSEKEALELEDFVKNEYKVDVLTIKCDVSKEDEVRLMIKKVIDKFGHIDCLVNNAGIAIDSLVEDKTYDNFMKTLSVNLVGTFLVSREVARYMMKEKTGSIINISSTNGIDTNYPYSLDYDASKAGVISLSNNLAEEYAPFVRVNTIAPGWINTEMNKELDEDYKREECEHILLKRFAEPEEIADVVYFLDTKEASYINKSVIRVDGGYK